ncbi:hypothetical protein YC2023_109148 [Brassica napus]
MVMTLSCSNKSMFPPYENDFEKIEEQFMSRFGVKPRPHWITTEFGGKGAHHAYGSQGSYERRPGVVKRAEEARGGHYRKVDQNTRPVWFKETHKRHRISRDIVKYSRPVWFK